MLTAPLSYSAVSSCIVKGQVQYIDEILVKPFLCPVTSTVIVVIAEHPYFMIPGSKV